MLGMIEGRRRRGREWMRWLDGISELTDMSLSKLRETVKKREAWHAAVHGASKVRQGWATEQQQKLRIFNDVNSYTYLIFEVP